MSEQKMTNEQANEIIEKIVREYAETGQVTLTAEQQEHQAALRAAAPDIYKADGSIDIMAVASRSHKASSTSDIDAMIEDLGVQDLLEDGEIVEQALYKSNPHSDRVRKAIAKVVYKSQYPLMIVAYANDTALADPQLFNLLRDNVTPESAAAGERAYHFLEALYIRAKNIKLAEQAENLLQRPAGDKTPHLKCHFFWAAMVMSATWRGKMPEWLPEHFAEDLFEKDGTPKAFVPYDDVREEDVEICHKLIDYLAGQFKPRKPMPVMSKKKLRKLRGF